MIRRLSFDHAPEELASRRSGTTEVALLWSKRAHRAAVAVEDSVEGTRFELLVDPGDNALDLFEHPYFYAARRGIAA